FSSSSRTTASRPLAAAYDSGVQPSVQPSLALDSTSAPFSISSFTIASCPPFAAHGSGVRPRIVSLGSTSAPFSSSSFIIASCPFAAAHDSGRPPDLLFRIRLDIVPLDQQLHHRLVSVLRGLQQRHPAALVLRVHVEVGQLL